jgi:thermitase
MKRTLVAGLLVLVLILILGGALPAAADDPTPYMAGEVLVKIHGQWEKRNVPPGQEKAEIARLRGDPDVEYAEVNGLWSVVETIPNEPRWAEQYGPTRIKAPQAWDLSKGSAAVIISIIDTGVACAHEDLAGKCEAGFDFVNNDPDPADDHGHGTHVAGIAAAVTDNSIGVAGICWLCRIQPVKVLSNFGSGTWEQVAAGIVWASDHGSDVINMSLGGTGFSQIVQDAVIYAEANGVLIFAAAGNSGGEGVLYPAKYAQVIAVAATDSLDNRASFSTYGLEVELAAPGVGNLSSVPTGSCSLCDPSGYRSLSGTSMATPHAAGTGGLLLSFRSDLTNVDARQVLQLTAADKGTIGWDKFYGFGLVDAYAALSFGGEFPTPTPTLEPTETPIPTDTPVPTLTPTRQPGTAVCGKITGGAVWLAAGSPFYLTCNVDIKGGLVAVNVEIQLRGFSLTATGIYFQDVRMIP